MILKSLKLNYFRNYNRGVFEFNDNLNIILGNNGTGKTTLLEAIHCLSLTKSFRTHKNSDVIKYNCNYFQIFGIFTNSKKEEINVNFNYSNNDGKALFINRIKIEKIIDIIGKIPVIILSPSNQRITEGGPLLRRSFIDRILSQIDPGYLSTLIEFKKSILQRNALLTQYKDEEKYKYDPYIETIDDILIEYALQIQKMRESFINDFNPLFKEVYRLLNHINHTVYLKNYRDIEVEIENFRKRYKQKLKSRIERDINYGRTATGPHLDRISFIFNDRDIRYFGSQGEHKIYLMALKLAEGRFIEEKTGEKVIFLLDDLFALLDRTHCTNIIKLIGPANQTFITATDMAVLERSDFNIDRYDHKILKLLDGAV